MLFLHLSFILSIKPIKWHSNNSISLHFFFLITTSRCNNCSGLFFREDSECLALTKDANAAIMLSEVGVLCACLQCSHAMCDQLVSAAASESFKVLLEVSLGGLAPVANGH